MSPNPYSLLATRLKTELAEGLAALGYDAVEGRRGVWDPRRILPFARYLVFVAPPTIDPWREVREEGPKLVTEILRADIFLLVQNYDEDLSVYGDTAPNLGVFQMFSDVQSLLRDTDLGGLISRNYREIEGGSGFWTGASPGFETGSQTVSHRMRLTYTGRLFPFCHPA